MSNMRSWISLFEKELLQEAQHYGICYHGTTSKFVPSILKGGFKADPEKKTYGTTGALVSYPGTYFSDTFTVAFHRGHAATEVFGGKTCVFICEVDHDVYADEDGILEFLEELLAHLFDEEDFDLEKYVSDEDTEYHQEINKIVLSQFYQEYESYPSRDFYDLFLDYITDSASTRSQDPTARNLVNKVSKQVGLSRAPGNSQALNFRVNENLDQVKILAVIQCKYDLEPDPTYTPPEFTYKVIYGELPPEIKQELD